MQGTKTQLQSSQAWREKPLVLIGLMGAGKSTIGRRLAKKLGWKFIDSDDEIVEAAGCSIADIFAIHGEGIFRDLEARVIKRLMQRSHCVIATGGGAWIQESVRTDIKTHATSVWLRAQLPVLLSRVEHRSHRPLLETGDKQGILQKLMDERYPLYEKADITVDSGATSHEKVVDAVLEALARYMLTCEDTTR